MGSASLHNHVSQFLKRKLSVCLSFYPSIHLSLHPSILLVLFLRYWPNDIHEDPTMQLGVRISSHRVIDGYFEAKIFNIVNSTDFTVSPGGLRSNSHRLNMCCKVGAGEQAEPKLGQPLRWQGRRYHPICGVRVGINPHTESCPLCSCNLQPSVISPFRTRKFSVY